VVGKLHAALGVAAGALIRGIREVMSMKRAQAEHAQAVTLRCMSCDRTAGTGPNGVDTFSQDGVTWCARCAYIAEIPPGSLCVLQPSPGRMTESETISGLDRLRDCYILTPKRRIKKADAKEEIQRAWDMWKGDGSSSEAMYSFFLWLRQNRPYFLTFRGEGRDPWQTVHPWLIQHEDRKQAQKPCAPSTGWPKRRPVSRRASRRVSS
jgi:hypothetical protein